MKVLSIPGQTKRLKSNLPAERRHPFSRPLASIASESEPGKINADLFDVNDKLAVGTLPVSRHPESGRLRLIDLAGLLYAVSLHKFAPPRETGGYSAIIVAAALLASFLCVFLASWRHRKTYSPSLAMIALTIVGVLALASSWRSSIPTVSFVQGVLCLVVLATCYLLSQSGLDARYFRSVYRSYVFLLALGLVANLLLPHTYPLWTIDEYSGRTTFSVFHTFFGVMGEDAALMVLLAPLVFDKPLWISGTFLLAMNLLAGEKAPTIVLLVLLAIRFIFSLRKWRSWRTVGIIFGLSCLVSLAVYSSVNSASSPPILSTPMKALYGGRVSQNAASLDGRLDLWKRAIELFPTVPVLGYGFDGDRDLMLQVAKWSGSAHNSYLEVALSSGLLGVVFFAIAAASILSSCLRAPIALRLPLVSLLTFLGTQGIVGILFYNPSFIGLLLLAWCSYRVRRVDPLL